MSELDEDQGLGSADILSPGARSDLRLGGRTRRGWKKIKDQAEAAGYTEMQVRGFVNGNGLFASDADRRALATSLGFDWESAAEFFATIAPIIMEMFAACV